ncbi:MAG: Holliday junction branch migration protein RuvA [Gammaproteobacteria bacterium TMED92]|nr:MAG: Holliday junction branch migration protein RuvA [Gammaproteobacteria bacterium TMED92]
MIGRLTGTLIEIDAEQAFLLLDVGGVGYELEASTNALAAAPAIGETMTLSTHFVVREDAQLLFGFCDSAERELFRTVVKINGVGPKLALAIISALDPATLSVAVENNEVGVLTGVSGVGKKTAERLIVELKSKLQDLLPTGSIGQHSESSRSIQQAVGQEAQDALVALGYKPLQAQQMVAQLQQTEDLPEQITTEQLVSMALRNAARRGINP